MPRRRLCTQPRLTHLENIFMRTFLKKTVRKAFNACGFEITRIWGAQRVTMDQVLANIVKLGFEPQTVVDIGVGDGTYDLYRAFPNASHLLIEPLEERKSVMDKIVSQFDAQYVLACAGDTPGKITLNVHTDHLNGSSVFKEQEGTHADGMEREVAVVTIDQVCVQKNLTGPFLIKVDTQGAELKTLDGAAKTIQNTELVILEIQLFQTLVGCPQLYEVVEYMKKRGFVVYDCFGSAYRPLDGALAAMDIAFVKENGLFRKSHAFATKDQRGKMKKIFVGTT